MKENILNNILQTWYSKYQSIGVSLQDVISDLDYNEPLRLALEKAVGECVNAENLLHCLTEIKEVKVNGLAMCSPREIPKLWFVRDFFSMH